MNVLSVALNNIVSSFLYSKADEVIKNQLKEFQICLQSMKNGKILGEIKHIVRKPVKLINSIRESMDPIKIETSITFACDRCGVCCKSFRIGISWADIEDYIRNDMYHMLSVLILPEDRNYFQLMNKRQFVEATPPFSQALTEKLLQINPSLGNVGEDDFESCVFYNPDHNACSIQASKPLECKIYPVGNIVFGDDENACDKSCFLNGNVQDVLDIARDLEKKRVPDFALSLLYDTVPDGSWRLDFFKLALLFEKLRSIL
jgi:Fe-S-cluster containining protein